MKVRMLLLLVGAVLLAGCGVISAPESTPTTGAQPTGAATEAPTSAGIPTVTLAPSATPAEVPTAEATAPVPETVNVAQAAGLADTVRIEVAKVGAIANEPLPEPVTITEPSLIQAVVGALDEDAPLLPPADCSALYTLRFFLSDGSEQAFAYGCEGRMLLRGEQAFFAGGLVMPGPALDDLIASRFGTPTVAVNVVALAGLGDATGVDVAAWDAAEGAFVHRLAIADAEKVAALVSALQGELALIPQADCRAHYRLRFALADGSEVELRAACGEGAVGFVRGEQPFFEGQDAQAPQAFADLLLAELATP